MDRILARMKKSSGRRGGDKIIPVRRLERRDAARNINYDAASCSSSSAEDLSVSTSSLMTRSLEFPEPTSFRIGGGGEGEMDRIYRSLGVSGPDDLAISFDAWEACKKRSSSDVVNRFKSFDIDNHKVQERDLNEAGPSGVVVTSNSMNHLDLSEAGPSGVVVASSSTNRDINELMPSELSEIGNLSTPVDREVVDGGTPGMVENRRGFERTPTILVKSKGYLVPNDVVAVGGGIKGVRPPVLKPPPAMKRPPIDLRGSSWDFLTHFAPSETVKRPSSSSSSSENGCDEAEAKEEEVETEETGARFIQLGDTADEACSFTTNEGDTSSTVSNTSPIYPDGGSIITSWQKGQLLGRGSFGSVYEGISGDGDFFAVKEVSLLDQGSQAQECIQQLEGEIALLSQLQHQNIVRYRGTAKDGSNLYIFLELVTQGSLLKLYQRYQLRDSVVSLYTRQILDGLKYLHDKGFIHRDIKCANILVDANGAVKLADFGLAKVSKFNDIKSCKGTPFWMAPEVINRKDNDGYGSPADIWSLGCTVLEMCTGKIPYSDLEPVQALFRIGRGTLPEVPDTLSLDARHFILKCLKVNPEERPTAAELLNHPFVRRPLPSMGSGGSGSASPLLHR
ncbi:Protein kinase domain [Arabidopsis thaliana x Arabidopsis arenosa]|uniref:mitogen-activated protein kinase kinase kinase n=1 Tax=Arabidopsis thaliana x Arabidopsis arenosa TaxID=1240361 RepID=A0A8T1Z170_9BRAS|nr:Protein kinase domain [Arabidopsis thaliana x Arabidopsis arenosa]